MVRTVKAHAWQVTFTHKSHLGEGRTDDQYGTDHLFHGFHRSLAISVASLTFDRELYHEICKAFRSRNRAKYPANSRSALIKTGPRFVISARITRTISDVIFFLCGGLKNTVMPVASVPEYSNDLPMTVLLVGTVSFTFVTDLEGARSSSTKSLIWRCKGSAFTAEAVQTAGESDSLEAARPRGVTSG
jgi:hypothetical protein